MSSELSDVTGVGPKTVDALKSIGITDTATLCRAYFLHPGHTVEDVISSTTRLHRYFFRNPAVELEAEKTMSLPVPDAGVVAVMAFAREFGTKYTNSAGASWANDAYETTAITPDDIDWSESAFIAEPRNTFGVLHNPKTNADEGEFNHLSVDTVPTTVSGGDDGNNDSVHFRTDDGSEVSVDGALIERVSAFTGTDYQQNENLDSVRIHSTRNVPVYFNVGTAYPIAIAPIVQPDDDSTTSADEETAEPASS